MNEPAPDVVYAGFIRRFAAYIIDGLVITVAFYALAIALAFAVFLMAPGLSENEDTLGAAVGVGYLLLMALYYPAAACYYALQESSRHQATLGKRAMGIKVTDAQGQRLGTGQAFGRWFAALLSYLTFYIGFLMAGFTERKRALHDMIANTLVVDRWAFTDTPERQQREAGAAVILVLIVGFFMMIFVLGILAAIAIPAYQDYTLRAKASAAIASAQPLRPLVAGFADSQGSCPENGEGGIGTVESYAGNQIAGIATGALQDSGACAIEITLAEDPSEALAGKRIWLELDTASGAWTCSSEIEDRYLPASCRG